LGESRVHALLELLGPLSGRLEHSLGGASQTATGSPVRDANDEANGSGPSRQ
jgi:hypothetical protein